MVKNKTQTGFLLARNFRRLNNVSNQNKILFNFILLRKPMLLFCLDMIFKNTSNNFQWAFLSYIKLGEKYI